MAGMFSSRMETSSGRPSRASRAFSQATRPDLRITSSEKNPASRKKAGMRKAWMMSFTWPSSTLVVAGFTTQGSGPKTCPAL